MRSRRTWSVLLFCLGVALAGSCAAAGDNPIPELSGITHIEVWRGRQLVARISEPGRVAAIVAFANRLRSGWGKPWAGVPVGDARAVFYREQEVRGSLGVGVDFFETQRIGDFFARRAEPGEAVEFRKLLGIPLSGPDAR